jgi:hypothetical protein
MLWMLLGTILLVAPAQSQAVPTSRAAEQRAPFELATATVLALSEAATGRDLIAGVKAEGNAIADSLNAIVANRGAISRLRQAIVRFDQFKDSRDKQVSEAAVHMQLALENLSARLMKSVGLWEKLSAAKTEEAVTALVPEAGKIAADVDEAWRTLPIGLASGTHAMVDQDRLSPTGTLAYLRVTREERARILADLKTFFPKVTGAPKGGHPVDVAASLFIQFLNTAWKNADDK